MNAFELALAYARHEADPVVLIERALEKARASSSVFISLTEDRARREAAASRARWRSDRPLSPLDGVPIAWKDLFDIEGCVTTAGSLVFSERPPAEQDASIVSMASRAGLVSLGKTNLSELAYSGLGLNPHFGTPLNPFDKKKPRIPGGSSSGSAIAVATGIVPIAVGTDTAGSIRVPAAFNGLVGFKGSISRYSKTGVFPLSRTLDALGPIAASVIDCAFFDRILQGMPGKLLERRAISKERFVVDENLLSDSRLQSEVRANLLATTDKIKDLGGSVEYRPVEAIPKTLSLLDEQGWLGSIEAYTEHEQLVLSPAADRLDQRIRRRLESAKSMPGTAVVRLLWERGRLLERIAVELDGALLVMPTVNHVAPELDPLENDVEKFLATNIATLRNTRIGNFLDMPSVAYPSGTDSVGLPTSILFSTTSGQDDHLLEVMLALESAFRPELSARQTKLAT